MSYISFNRKNNRFFDELKEKVNKYFSDKNVKRTGNYKIYLKTIIFLLLAFFTYFALIASFFPGWVSWILCGFLGAVFAGIGFNIMHDGAHGSYSSKKWLNELMGYSLNVIGGNVFIWKNKHNLNHHSYTNIEGLDDDINIEPWIRTNPNQLRRWYHRYQHLYGLILYGTTYLYWVFVNDFKKYFSKKIADTDLVPMDWKEHLIFWVSKIFYFIVFLLIPMLTIGVWQTLVGFFIMAYVCGLIIGVVFQLAHVVEEAEFPMPSEDSNKMEQDWILHQIATTVNFAVKNKTLSWLIGGLNFQVVHHIFPKISHIHYQAINELVRETCKKFQIKYTEYPSFWSALRAHIFYLKYIGSHS